MAKQTGKLSDCVTSAETRSLKENNKQIEENEQFGSENTRRFFKTESTNIKSSFIELRSKNKRYLTFLNINLLFTQQLQEIKSKKGR